MAEQRNKLQRQKVTLHQQKQSKEKDVAVLDTLFDQNVGRKRVKECVALFWDRGTNCVRAAFVSGFDF